MRRAIVALGIGCLLLGCPVPESGSSVRELLRHPIESLRLYLLLRSFESAAESKDPDAMAALVHPDAEHRGLTTGRLVQGRPARHYLWWEFLITRPLHTLRTDTDQSQLVFLDHKPRGDQAVGQFDRAAFQVEHAAIR